MLTQTTPIAQTNHFIVLDKYQKKPQTTTYQSEADLEKELITDLVNQGYEYRQDINNHDKLLANVRVCLQNLNHIAFTDREWTHFVEEYLDKPADGLIEKTTKIHDDHIHDFVFDDGHVQNIYLLDKKQLTGNKLQLISQFEQTGTYANRYDVTILVNGLPLVQIELKKRGVAIREAFNQIHRYTKESFNKDNSLFKYLQIFIISNGTDTRYFANTTKRDKNSFDFTMNWARADNTPIKDLKDFSATFFEKKTLLNVLINYSVFDVRQTLLIMRPYQIAATERILWKIASSYHAKNWSNPTSGGYIWHTTGSGKTLTSFKAARLATELDFIDKVFFVVDRKDLDEQTIKEYRRFSPDSVNGSTSTTQLKQNIAQDDNKIIVTTIQKLNNLIKSENNLPIYDKQVVFIFDECHRSQFGEAQKNIQKKFKKFYQFGFTGTPIFPDNASDAQTTADVFGQQLHSYVITDAIRDEKVLKFKVDYHNVLPKFKTDENEQDLAKLSAAENRKALMHPERIREISRYILDRFHQKTHRNNATGKGFNAMLAVSSVNAAKLYYETLNDLQKDHAKPLKIATIFSYTANEAQDAIGEIEDESFEVSAMNSTAKEFLQSAISDYNAYFKENFSVSSKEFENYYRNLSKRVKNQEIDLLIVVGMFLTGFDAPTLNTLFVDKNLRYHGLIQAYSRTNRIYNATKTFGNIVTFRNLEEPTIEAIKLFGNKNTRHVVLEQPLDDYLDGYTDVLSGDAHRGFIAIIDELNERFGEPDNIITEIDKKDFAKLFGEYLRTENALKNFDEYQAMMALKRLPPISDEMDEATVTQITQSIQEIQNKYQLDDDTLERLDAIALPSERMIQDYRSTYNDICDWISHNKHAQTQADSTISWDDVVFEVDLLKSQEINLDYILGLIFEHNQQAQDKTAIVDEIRRLIRSSLAHRAKESLIVDFIHQTNFDELPDKAGVIESFYQYAQAKQKKEADELISDENLNKDAALRYIATSLKRGYASENGTGLNDILPKMSPLNPNYLTKKQSVFQKIAHFVEKFKGIGDLAGLLNKEHN